MEYLRQCTKGMVPDEKLQAYVDAAPRILDELAKWNVGWLFQRTGLFRLPALASRRDDLRRSHNVAPALRCQGPG